ncbi:MAG: DUF1810 domain-containing protein [Methyloceanibacter sp.]|uniref:DUF1810 domain-containing protein n=1 Tax=Methyloceanibacter sp. TaxID=1965321 RepID=UPI003C5082B2
MGLERFIEAQSETWASALEELERGAKQSHWMWFIFPQLAALGRSDTAKYYGIQDLAEARAYLAHPVLSARLETAARAVLRHPERPVAAIMGPIDALKLRSSATLFHAAGGGPVFQDLLDTFYDGVACPATHKLLDKQG